MLLNISTIFRLGIPYNEAECNYFKLLLEQMFQYETYSIPNMIALNLSSSTVTSSQAARTKKVTKQRAQDLLEEWVSRGYFVNANERIQLGPRSIGEFGEVLSTEYAEYVKKCYLCKNVSFKVCFNIYLYAREKKIFFFVLLDF